MYANKNDICSFDSTIGSVNAGGDTPGFDYADSPVLFNMVKSADCRKKAGMNIRQDKTVDQLFTSKGRSAVDGLLHRAHIATEHQQKFSGA